MAIELNFDKRYKNFIKESGNERKAERIVKHWFKNGTKRPIINASQDFKITKGRLEAGRIYYFEYDPLHKKTLAYYDTRPLVLALGPSKTVKGLDLGINLHFLPRKYKREFLKVIFKVKKQIIKQNLKNREQLIAMGKTPNASREQPLTIYYDLIKRILPTELEFAIRSYYNHRRTKAITITNDKWHYLPLTRIEDIQGVSLAFVYKLWYMTRKSRR